MGRNDFNSGITIPAGNVKLEGELIIPANANSLVLFSHGSGSSRFSPRNNYVAEILREQNMATFLFDLLTKEEDELYSNRFNIDLLTKRLILASEYIASQKDFSHLKIGYFGASTGAASALKAAAALPDMIHAVVSRGGRPDMAIDVASKVKAPTLLIVGELDDEVLELNRHAYTALRCEKKLEIVPGATHLFEEPGTLHEAAMLAGEWFKKYLIKRSEMLTRV